MKKEKIFSSETGILPKIPKEELYKLLGQITSLLLSSDLHRRYLIDDIGAMFLPAIHLNQFKIYKNKNGDPVGLVTWAWLSDEAEEAYKKGTRNLKLNDWNSGKNFWCIDFIAPFGHAKQISKDLRKTFVGKSAKSLVVKGNKIQRIGNWRADNYNKNNNTVF